MFSRWRLDHFLELWVVMAPQVAGEVMGEARSFRDHVCPVSRAFVDAGSVVGLDQPASGALVRVDGSQGDAGGDCDERQEEEDCWSDFHGMWRLSVFYTCARISVSTRMLR